MVTCPNLSDEQCTLAGVRVTPRGCEICRESWDRPPTTVDDLPEWLRGLPPWDVSMPAEGLGDTIAKLTHKLGIGRKCGGCHGRRRRKLNRLVPYKRV